MENGELRWLEHQVDTLRQVVSELVELQRGALAAQPAPSESLLDQLDELRTRLRPLRADGLPAVSRPGVEATPRFGEIAAERINIVEPDGTLRLTISNKTRAPDPVLDGRTLKRGDGNVAGLIFFNEQGDECGGLVFTGEPTDGEVTAGAGLFFDQFRQDQTVGIQYSDRNGRRKAGLMVWDRPEFSLIESVGRFEAAMRIPDGAERRATLAALQAEHAFGTTRVFVGKDEAGTAAIMLHDQEGRIRLRLLVDAAGTPKLEMLDADGRVEFSVPNT